jgi:uncharacterized membrane protein YjgN (DUF898 family)
VTVIGATAGTPASVPHVPSARPVPVAAGRVRFLGKDRDYWRLLVRGALLLMVTLGIYRFWLVTDMRRFLWANTEVAGDTLEYSGTARELLIGFLIAVTLLVPINVAFFVAGLTVLGQGAAVLGFIVLAWFGQFAIYRARRYRLTRTVYRGIRFQQTGAAWRYAFCALFWWSLTIVTLGLAYPWGQASLERYKMRHTFYGDLGARFAGSGTGLFVRGILMWLVVAGPFALGMTYAIGAIDWTAVASAIEKGGPNPYGRLEEVSPNLGLAMLAAVGAAAWPFLAGALLYPAFQAMVLRWWISGVRFGDVVVASHLRTGQLYGVYFRFFLFALLFAIVIGVVALIGFALFGLFLGALAKSNVAEIVGTAAAVAGYVVVMLGYSTIYQATVKLRTWRAAFESVELSGLPALESVKARGAPSSAFGEGLADALNVGGI